MNLFRKIRVSEYLSLQELLQIKVIIINILSALLLGPIFYFITSSDTTLFIKIITPLISLLFIYFSIAFANEKYTEPAIHLSIITIIFASTTLLFNVPSFFAFLLIFVIITVIAYYEDVRLLIIYGAVSIGIWFYFIYINPDTIIYNSLDTNLELIIHYSLITLYYLIVCLYVLFHKNEENKLSIQWMELNALMQSYHRISLTLSNENVKGKIYRKNGFINGVKELTHFLNDVMKNDFDIDKYIKLYFLIQKNGLEKILFDDSIDQDTKILATKLHNYTVNDKTDLISILLNFSTFLTNEEGYDENRYNFMIENYTDSEEESMLSLILIYLFLRHEITQFDENGKLTKSLTHQEVIEIFNRKEINKYLSSKQINIFKDNESLFEKLLV